VASLPEGYPSTAAQAAQELAQRVPSDAQLVAFLGSFAAVVELIDTVRSWHLVDPRQLDGVFADLGWHHGFNPADAKSYEQSGLSLERGVLFGMLDGSPFLILPVDDLTRFESLMDSVVNEEYGRPRRHVEQHGERTLTSVLVRKEDFLSYTYVDGCGYVAIGTPIWSKAGPSPDTLKRLLDTQASKSMASSEAFVAMRERLAERGPVFVYSPNQQVARDLVKPLLAGSEAAESFLNELFFSQTNTAGVALMAKEKRLALSWFLTLPEASASALKELGSPDPSSAEGLARLIDPQSHALGHFTFSPKTLEKTLFFVLPAGAQQTWEKLKKQLSVRFILNFEDEVLYNLSGHALLNLFSIEENALARSGSATDAMRAVDAALYLPMKNADKANSYFGKVSAIKDLLPQGAVEIEERNEVLLITLRHQRAALLRIAYYDGVLAACTGENTIASVIERLKSSEKVPAAKSFPIEVLQDGIVWTLSVDVRQIVAVLSAKFDIVRVQIAKFLAPLDYVSAQLRVEDEGVGIELSIDMTPPQTDE
jgi:hypothetical protein